MMDLPECVQEMLGYKESLGFSRKTYESFLNDFKNYFSMVGHTEFMEETVLPWCERRDTETPEGFQRRVIPLRELSKYMYAMGDTDYIVPTSIFPITHRGTPYIFTDSELQRLFAESDREPYCKASPCRHLIIPVIYRLIYFCGLRPNEGRELKRSDFSYGDRTLCIRKNKAHRERLIPVSDDVAAMCQEYIKKSRAVFPDTEYMFPSPTGEPYQKKWLADTFLRLWDASKPTGSTKRVRVYLLRHRYATAVFMKWLDEKADLNARLPYLSAYMGHASFEDTTYYIHLMPENLLASATVDWEKFNALIPEVEDEE
ncbi:MAG: tyrosine-type recombinase/integrase [Clostridia bacterium]|nr:tyrosine-type recombinase/integrase [Clostridia bacterium]